MNTDTNPDGTFSDSSDSLSDSFLDDSPEIEDHNPGDNYPLGALHYPFPPSCNLFKTKLTQLLPKRHYLFVLKINPKKTYICYVESVRFGEFTFFRQKTNGDLKQFSRDDMHEQFSMYYTFQISGKLEQPFPPNLRVQEVSDLRVNMTYVSIPERFPGKIKLMKFRGGNDWLWCTHEINSPIESVYSSDLVCFTKIYRVKW